MEVNRIAGLVAEPIGIAFDRSLVDGLDRLRRFHAGGLGLRQGQRPPAAQGPPLQRTARIGLLSHGSSAVIACSLPAPLASSWPNSAVYQQMVRRVFCFEAGGPT